MLVRVGAGDEKERTFQLGTILSTVSVKLKLPGCRLEVQSGPCSGLSKEFDQRRVKLGRSDALDNDLILSNDPSVSSFHCEFIFDEGEGYRLRDPGSTNGVWLGGVRLHEAHITTPVQLLLGDSSIRFTPLDRTVEVTQTMADQIAGFYFRDRAMRQLFVRAGKLVQLGVDSILLYGETGSGKGAIAALLRQRCQEQDLPFETVNCAGIPEHLLESELFGYLKGAFTGSMRDHVGALKRADGGILFLDEVGELPLSQQAKLLTSLDKRGGVYEFRPIGATKHETSRFVLLAGTNRNLRDEVKEGRFREDLYYRIAGCELYVPPLRERPSDIECLLDAHLETLGQQHLNQRLSVTSEVRERLMQYSWPGNVREFLHTINHAAIHAISADRTNILIDDLPRAMLLEESVSSASSGALNAQGIDGIYPTDKHIPSYHDAKNKVLEEFQREYLSRLLEYTEGNVSLASRIAGLDRKRITSLRKLYFGVSEDDTD